MNAHPRVSRRDFFRRLRSIEPGRTVELSCRTLFMRCNDSTIPAAPAGQDYDTGAGEPAAVFVRRSPDDLMASLDQELQDVDVLRLSEPEWLENMVGGDRLGEIIASFQGRGGRVEHQPRANGE